MPELIDATTEPSAQGVPHTPARPGAALQRARKDLHRITAHKMRCRELGRPSEAELARMVAEFFARGGQVTHVPTCHVESIQNGAGRDADRWTI